VCYCVLLSVARQYVHYICFQVANSNTTYYYYKLKLKRINLPQIMSKNRPKSDESAPIMFGKDLGQETSVVDSYSFRGKHARFGAQKP
jgi:hypothetical protein